MRAKPTSFFTAMSTPGGGFAGARSFDREVRVAEPRVRQTVTEREQRFDVEAIVPAVTAEDAICGEVDRLVAVGSSHEAGLEHAGVERTVSVVGRVIGDHGWIAIGTEGWDVHRIDRKRHWQLATRVCFAEQDPRGGGPSPLSRIPHLEDRLDRSE